MTVPRNKGDQREDKVLERGKYREYAQHLIDTHTKTLKNQCISKKSSPDKLKSHLFSAFARDSRGSS